MQRTVCLLKIGNWKMKGWYPAFTMTKRGLKNVSDVPDAVLICQILQMWHKNWSTGILGIYLSVGLQCFCFWIPAACASCWGFNHNTTHIASIIVEEQYISMCGGTFNNLPDYLKNVSYKLNRCFFDSVAFLLSWHWCSSKWRSDVLAVMSLQSCCRAAFISLSYSEQLHQIMSLCLLC